MTDDLLGSDMGENRSNGDDGRPVAVDLFAGAGGMSLGFEQAGFDVLVAVDNDPVHLAVHSYNFPAAEVISDDVADLLAESIESAVRKGWAAHGRPGEWDGEIDCLFGGPSCQGFSYIGSNNTGDERNGLVFEFARLIEELQPKTFVIENVPGLLSDRFRATRLLLIRRLASAGYRLVNDEPLVLDAADFGVPQWRRRLFIIGAREDVKLPVAPSPLAEGPSVRDAFVGLPNADDWVSLLDTDLLELTPKRRNQLEKTSSAYGRTLRRQFAFEYERDWNPRELSGCQRTQHTPGVERRFSMLPPGGEDRPSRFRRLDPSGKSFTLRAGTGRDHGSFTAPRPIHFRYERVITVREAARLHSFPDWFRLHRTKWHGLRQIGNAVPPRLAYVVGRSVLASLGLELLKPSCSLALGDPNLLGLSLGEAADHFGYSRDRLPPDVRPNH